MDKIEIYEVFIDENDETGVDKISLVKRPAIMSDFIWMNDESDELYKKVSLSDEKRIITGPALIPDLEIIRKDDNDPYYIKYSAQEIENIVQKFFKHKDQWSVNKDHKTDVKGVYIFESWIVGENDKSKDLGLDVPVGSWMVSMKIEDDEIWNSIKSGKIKGFSIEGFFKFRMKRRFKQECSCGDDLELESYNDYPDSAKNNAKRALEWAEKNGWGDCGTAVGKNRANQLANGENISEETIARMASFARHRQNKDVPYSEGCGGLMWDSWGGTSGIEWAQNKLKEIRQNKIEMAGEPGLVHPNCRCSIRRGEFRLSKPRTGKNGEPMPCEVCKQAKNSWDNNGFFEDVFETRFNKTNMSEWLVQKNVDQYNLNIGDEVKLVKPSGNENREEFISRCMGDDKMNSEFPDNDQRAAVCYAYWVEKQEKINVNMVSSILKSGETIYTDAEAMAVGVEVYFQNEAGEKIAVEGGEYELEDGSIVVVAESKISEIKEPVAAGDDYKEEEKKEDEVKAEIDPMLMEQFDALKGMIENLNLKIDTLIGSEMLSKVEQMEIQLEKIVVGNENKKTEPIDSKKVEMSSQKSKNLDYDMIKKYSSKF